MSPTQSIPPLLEKCVLLGIYNNTVLKSLYLEADRQDGRIRNSIDFPGFFRYILSKVYRNNEYLTPDMPPWSGDSV